MWKSSRQGSDVSGASSSVLWRLAVSKRWCTFEPAAPFACMSEVEANVQTVDELRMGAS